MGADKGEWTVRAVWGEEHVWTVRKGKTRLGAALQAMAEVARTLGSQEVDMKVCTALMEIQRTLQEESRLKGRAFLYSKWCRQVDTILHWQPDIHFEEMENKSFEGRLGPHVVIDEELHLYPLHIRERDGSAEGKVVHFISIRDWMGYFNDKRKMRVRSTTRIQGDWSWHLSAMVLVQKRVGWCCDSRLQPLEMLTVFNARHGGILKSGMQERCAWTGCTEDRRSLLHVLGTHADWGAACTEASSRAGRIDSEFWWWNPTYSVHGQLAVWLGYVPERVEQWLKRDCKNHKARSEWVAGVCAIFARRAVQALQQAHGTRGGRARQRNPPSTIPRPKVQVRMGADGGLVSENDGQYLVFGGFVDVDGVTMWEGYGRVRAGERIEGGASATLAEYIANVGVMRAYQELKWTHTLALAGADAEAIMDSKIVEGQTSGEFRCLEVPLRIGRDSMRRMAGEEQILVRHVMRNCNMRADSLAFKGRSAELNTGCFMAEWDEQQADLRRLAERLGVLWE
jgi:hypothetical protein